MDFSEISQQSYLAASEIIETAHLSAGRILVVGCSTSEVLGQKIGTFSSFETAKHIYAGISQACAEHGIFIAAQCCEHLNRAIIIESEAAADAEHVNVVPFPKAGGSFATVCYQSFSSPAALEHIKADAGIDIGLTMIGMHLKEVAVPVRLKNNRIGEATVAAARTRPKFIGGSRANYDARLL